MVTIPAEPTNGDPGALATAIEEAASPRTPGQVEEGIDRLEDATAQAERAIKLFNDLATGGALTGEWLRDELDLILNLIERLDREGDWEQTLRLARAAADLFALVRRWGALFHSLGIALAAAKKLGNRSAEAWASHQLGAVHLAAEDHLGASRALEKARAIRKDLGDQPGLAATEHNLRVLCRRLRERLSDDGNGQRKQLAPRPATTATLLKQALSRRLLFAAVAAFLLVFGLGLATGSVLGGGDGGSSERRVGGGGEAAGGSASANGNGGGTGGASAGQPATLDESVEFPDTSVGSSSTESLTATNGGPADITLGRFTIGGEHASDFRIESDGCSRKTVSQGQSCSVAIVFTPSTSGNRTASLSVDNTGTGQRAVVALSGSGVSSDEGEGPNEEEGPDGGEAPGTGDGSNNKPVD